MKKLMRKLVLSSFALGLAVITLSTTTFAWYTSNVEVKANNVSGASASSGSSLLMISNDPTPIAKKKWDTIIDVEYYNKEGEAVAEEPNELKPLHYITDAKEAEGNEGDDDYVPAKEATTAIFANRGLTTAVTTEDYIQFDLYFKMSGQQNETYLYITDLDLLNNMAALPDKDVLMANDAWRFVNSTWQTTGTENLVESTYNVDIRRALLVSAVAQTYTVNADSELEVTNTKVSLYNPEGLNQYNDSLKGLTAATNYDAHQYYNAIMCPDYATVNHNNDHSCTKCLVAPTDTEYGATKLVAADDEINPVYVAAIPASYDQATSTQHVKVTFTLFLNGWDYACFDACQGQDIELALTFGVSKYNDTFESVTA